MAAVLAKSSIKAGAFAKAPKAQRVSLCLSLLGPLLPSAAALPCCLPYA